jgi:hypothetical protein
MTVTSWVSVLMGNGGTGRRESASAEVVVDRLGKINRRLGAGNARVAVDRFGGTIDRDPEPATPERDRSWHKKGKES